MDSTGTLKMVKGQNADRLGFNFLKCFFLPFGLDQSQDVISGYFRNQRKNIAVCLALVGPKRQIMGIKS